MRWLDRDYLTASLSDEEAERRDVGWAAARDAMARSEVGAIGMLVGDIYLHDALIERLEQSAAGRVDLTVVGGDLQCGYERVALSYTEAAVVDDEAGTVPDLLRTGAEILYDEVHLLDGSRYEHSFILPDRGAFTVEFGQVEVARSAVAPKERDRLWHTGR